jgi:acetyl esterase/lipase
MFMGLSILLGCGPAVAAAPFLENVVFATLGSRELKLDLYLPRDPQPGLPLVVYIHGGSWRAGDYKACAVSGLTEYGFAVASIDYRFSSEAVFPAQIHDCKAAVRWLRAHAAEYGIDPGRIAAAGDSAGGHLAALLGLTEGEADLEGAVGGHLGESSQVQAVVDYFGPMDFVLRSRNQPEKTEPPDSPVGGLLGCPAGKNPKLAQWASPAFHVTKKAPPLLILHGDKDGKVFLDQSERMVKEYQEAGVGGQVTLVIVPGAGHGDPQFFSGEYQKKVADFLALKLGARS